MHATFTQLFKTVFTPSCDACGEPSDDMLCPSCRDRLARQAILAEMKVVDEVLRSRPYLDRHER